MDPDPSQPGPSGFRKQSDDEGLRQRPGSSKSSNDQTRVNNDGDNKSKIDPKPCSSKSSDTFDPQPSTSKTKTEAEELIDRSKNKSDKKNDQKSKQSPKNPSNRATNEGIPYSFPNFAGFNFGNSNFSFPSQGTQNPKKTYTNSEEYFTDLRVWLQQAFFWQSVSAAFPYFMMCQMSSQSLPAAGSTGSNPAQQFPFPQFPMPGFQYPPTTQVPQEQPSATVTEPQPEVIDGVECRIPSFWKRIAAEFIDFLLLFFVKIAVSYISVDFFHFVEMDTYDLFQKDVKLAYKTFIQITQDIVILELIHRLVVCAFETFWLVGGQNGRLGGATPGKSIMGLRVITCDSSTVLREGDDRIVVRPGGNLSLGTAFLRALTKNFVLALLIPTSFAFIFFAHNRTGYDMICNTIVVEEPIVPHRVPQD